MAELARDPQQALAVTAEEVAAGPPLRNRHFALSPTALFLEGPRARAHASRVESYVALLDKVLALYRSDARVRAFFGLPTAAERLIHAGEESLDRVTVARIDGYLDLVSDRLRVLENNADAPAGAVFTPASTPRWTSSTAGWGWTGAPTARTPSATTAPSPRCSWRRPGATPPPWRPPDRGAAAPGRRRCRIRRAGRAVVLPGRHRLPGRPPGPGGERPTGGLHAAARPTCAGTR